jgi:hypothetical protein
LRLHALTPAPSPIFCRLLVELLKTGAQWKAMPNVVGAIRNLCQNSSANKDAVREEGGIVGLVDLLKAGMESPAALKAAETLEVVLDNNAANEKATTSAILEQPQGREVLQSFNGLLERLQKASERVLMTAAERNDQPTFERAMREAKGLGVPAPITDLAGARALAVRDQHQREQARKLRRESLGLGSLTTPNEFLCPITQDVMVDPVVASDGHSYERQAIQSILDRGSLDGGAALSPLTREELETSLVPNINLRKRIREHDNEVESVAQQVLNSVGSRPPALPQLEGPGSGGPLALMPPGGGKHATPDSAGGSSKRPLTDGPAYVAYELEQLNMQRYIPAFEEHGYDSWTELQEMQSAQLDKLVVVVSMASNHADRLRNALGRKGLFLPAAAAGSSSAKTEPMLSLTQPGASGTLSPQPTDVPMPAPVEPPAALAAAAAEAAAAPDEVVKAEEGASSDDDEVRSAGSSRRPGLRRGRGGGGSSSQYEEALPVDVGDSPSAEQMVPPRGETSLVPPVGPGGARQGGRGVKREAAQGGSSDGERGGRDGERGRKVRRVDRGGPR